MTALVFTPLGAQNASRERALRLAVEDAGYSVCVRESLIKAENTGVSIAETMRKADLILCDVTGLDPGVLYRVGIAHGLDKPTVLVVTKGTDLPGELKRACLVLYDPSQTGWEQELQRGISLCHRQAEGLTSAGRKRSEHDGSVRGTQVDEGHRVLFALKCRAYWNSAGWCDLPPSRTSGPYPYRFHIDKPCACQIRVTARVWAPTNTHENVIDIIVDGKSVAQIRQGYEPEQMVTTALGILEQGRHTIAFPAHYEDLDGNVIEDKEAPISQAGHYWMLRSFNVVANCADVPTAWAAESTTEMR